VNTIATAQPTLKICKLHEEAQVPQAATAGSVGLDLSSLSSIEILPNRLVPNAYIVHTGIAVEIPKGYHGKVFLRSSIGAKTKLRLANGTGIIDSDYRGELMLLVENLGQYSEYISKGQRIAQLIIEKNEAVKISVVDKLSDTQRGTDGIGSTGK
jgi:dUTP pyrophosphatase